MSLLSQRNPKWSKIGLGSCKGKTIGSHGCMITAYAMLANTTPDKVNQLANKIKGYVNGCDVNHWKLAPALKLPFRPERNKPYFYPCIAEVNLMGFKHFVVLQKDGRQFDPWNGVVTRRYKILSYRNVTVPKVVPKTAPTAPKTPVTPKVVPTPTPIPKPSTSDTERLAKEILGLQDEIDELDGIIETLRKENNQLKEKLKSLTKVEESADNVSKLVDFFKNVFKKK